MIAPSPCRVLACGECAECRQGFDWRCRDGEGNGLSTAGAAGAYAEFVRVSPHALFRVPDELSDRPRRSHGTARRGFAQREPGLASQPGEPCLIMGRGAGWALHADLGEAARRGRRSWYPIRSRSEERRPSRSVAHASVDPRTQDPASIMREISDGARAECGVRLRRHGGHAPGGDAPRRAQWSSCRSRSVPFNRRNYDR